MQFRRLTLFFLWIRINMRRSSKKKASSIIFAKDFSACEKVPQLITSLVRLLRAPWDASLEPLRGLAGPHARLGERRKRCTFPPNSQGAARKSFWSWAPGSEAAGALLRSVSFATSGSEPSAGRQQAAATSGWARRWGALSVAVQLAVASTALGRAWPATPLPGPSDVEGRRLGCLSRSCGPCGRATAAARPDLRSDGLTCHADPSALDDFGTFGQQAGPRASEGMVAARVHGATTSWVGAAAAGAKR